MREALALAVSADAPRGPNPRVGCLLLSPDGTVVGRGYHRGAGSPHAEVAALADAGDAARGATAVVTLEPCRHTGRTGPCTQALIDAGIVRVVYAIDDPTGQAGGGAGVLRAAGIEVEAGLLAEEAAGVNRAWMHVQRHGRPFVTVKTAISLDGRVADATGGPTAITGPAARVFVHELRSRCDAVLVGTGTALVDDPQLTVRGSNGEVRGPQPLRAVMGTRDLPARLRVLDDAAPSVLLRTHDPREALRQLLERGVERVLVEGGPTITAAFLDAGLVDEIVWLVAPRLLGGGPVALPRLGTMRNVRVSAVRRIGNDGVIIGTITNEE